MVILSDIVVSVPRLNWPSPMERSRTTRGLGRSPSTVIVYWKAVERGREGGREGGSEGGAEGGREGRREEEKEGEREGERVRMREEGGGTKGGGNIIKCISR